MTQNYKNYGTEQLGR